MIDVGGNVGSIQLFNYVCDGAKNQPSDLVIIWFILVM
jgi:hypothetical protein